MGDSRIKDVSALLAAFFDGDKLRRGEGYANFFSSWEKIVGPRLAAHSKVADIDKGFLIVEAEHPGWIQLLQLRQSSILEDVARRYPELTLRGIAFRLVGQAAPASAPATPQPDPRAEPETAEQAEAGARALEDIPDPEFRALLSNLKKTMHGEGNH
jgi:hypothetical protein